MAVVPRNLSLDEYNVQFKQIVARVAVSFIWPICLLGLAYHHTDANINTVIHQLTFSFFVAYPTIYILELVLASIIRLCVLWLMEPEVFKLCPEVPVIFLPWTLTKHGFYASRVTLLLFAFCR